MVFRNLKVPFKGSGKKMMDRTRDLRNELVRDSETLIEPGPLRPEIFKIVRFWSGPGPILDSRTRTEPLGYGPIDFGPWIPKWFTRAIIFS